MRGHAARADEDRKAEDGKQLLAESQKVMDADARLMSGGWSAVAVPLA